MSAKTVDQYLNNVDYRFDPSYLPSDFALEFVNFIKLVNGEEGEEHKTPVVHFKMLDTMIYGANGNTANLCHRGVAKTTLLGEYLFLYLGVYGELPEFGKVDLALYVSDSIDNGVKNMRKNMEFRYENSDFLKKYMTIKFTDIRWEFTNIDGNKVVVKAYGAKTGVRGTKELGKRPVLAVLDDLISDEDARSATVIHNVEETVYKALDYAMHPSRQKTIWSGTPFNARDPLYKAVESGAWDVNVFPVCEEFPCEREDFRGSWPDRFTYDYVMDKYQKAVKSGKVDAFNQELMLRIMSDDDRVILPGDIRWYSRDQLLKNKENFNFYITTDFATSEKSSADNSVITVWAHSHDGSWFWVDGICKRQLMDKNIEDLFRFVQMYKPLSTGVEVSGQQGGFIPWLQNEMLTRNIHFFLASENNENRPGIRPQTSASKFERFMLIVPWFKSGKIYLPEELKEHPAVVELVAELELVSYKGFKSKHDDSIDTVTQLSVMKAVRPGKQEAALVQDKSGMWDLDFEDDSEDYGNSDYFV